MKKIVISGSSSLQEEMNKWLEYFKNKNFDILDYPKPIKGENFLVDFPPVHKEFYQALNNTDVHFIANEYKNEEAGYIGCAVFAEIAFAMGLKLSHNKNIKIILNKRPSQKNHFYEDLILWLDNGWIEVFDEDNL